MITSYLYETDFLMAKSDELRLRGISGKLKEELVNIAENEGINLSALLRPKLRQIVDSYPQQMKIRREA
jgi:hypothetical protein